MACPRTEHGQSLCHMTDHPDRPYESFCTTCNRRFRKEDVTWGSIAPILALIALLITLLLGRGNARTNAPSGQLEPIDVTPGDPVTMLEDIDSVSRQVVMDIISSTSTWS